MFISEDKKSITITLQELVEHRNRCLANEKRAVNYLEKSTDPVMSKMYETDRLKAKGMKEYIDGLLYNFNSRFCDADKPATAEEIIQYQGEYEGDGHAKV